MPFKCVLKHPGASPSFMSHEANLQQEPTGSSERPKTRGTEAIGDKSHQGTSGACCSQRSSQDLSTNHIVLKPIWIHLVIDRGQSIIHIDCILEISSKVD